MKPERVRTEETVAALALAGQTRISPRRRRLVDRRSVVMVATVRARWRYACPEALRRVPARRLAPGASSFSDLVPMQLHLILVRFATAFLCA